MKQVIIDVYDKYVVTLTDEEYEDLEKFNTCVSELLDHEKYEWVKGSIDYECED